MEGLHNRPPESVFGSMEGMPPEEFEKIHGAAERDIAETPDKSRLGDMAELNEVETVPKISRPEPRQAPKTEEPEEFEVTDDMIGSEEPDISETQAAMDAADENQMRNPFTGEVIEQGEEPSEVVQILNVLKQKFPDLPVDLDSPTYRELETSGTEPFLNDLRELADKPGKRTSADRKHLLDILERIAAYKYKTSRTKAA